MGFEIINILKKEKGFTNSQIAQMSGVTLSTLDKITSGVNTNPKLDTLQAICKVLGCTLNDFMDNPVKSDLSQLERMHIKKYRLLDQYGKEAVDGVLDVEWRRCNADSSKKKSVPPSIVRPVVTLNRPYTQVAAAEGAGAFLIDGDYDEVTVSLNPYTQKADTILKVVGKSMEPEIKDGDHILVRKQPSVEEKEIGVFIIDGNAFLKQAAKNRLVSLNPNIEDVIIKDQQTVECYGKYICVLDPDWVVEESHYMSGPGAGRM